MMTLQVSNLENDIETQGGVRVAVEVSATWR